MQRIGWRRSEAADEGAREALLSREWLVTNGLGGYASGTIGGVVTRRYHGLLVAALPNPLGRTMMLNHVSEQIKLADGSLRRFGSLEVEHRVESTPAEHLLEFRLEGGLPVWVHEVAGFVIEKRLSFAHMQNTVFLGYRLLEGKGGVRLSLRPAVHFRGHDEPVDRDLGPEYTLSIVGERFELSGPPVLPPLRLRILGRDATFEFERRRLRQVTYRVEESRGYAAIGELWSHGQFKAELARDAPVTLVASTEPWETSTALSPEQAFRYEELRRRRLVRVACADDDPVAGELAVAADAFLIAPAGRVDDATRARAQGEELRTVIAGYHWFTDWGRDTMISLEGLTLSTGRHVEARWILHAFAHYVRDGLLPNLFPEGAHQGLYHTADATLWYFHAIDRYVAETGDRTTLRDLLPVLEEIVAAHRRGTRFGIRVDEDDGLLVQGEEGYALTWMDAKCDGWVVTPRRGKAVELQALWYGALSNLARWLEEERGEGAEHAAAAERVRSSFVERFVRPDGSLRDVVDGDPADEDELRPNQIFAVSLPNAVLPAELWPGVVDAVERELLTPVGLRSLARADRDYKPTYHGDLRTRDAAYHQGTVWSWLIGPFVDAWLRVHPGEDARARRFLAGLVEHLGDACIGSVSEVFDAEPPFRARGCVAQAWGVAELLRAWKRTAGRAPTAAREPGAAETPAGTVA